MVQFCSNLDGPRSPAARLSTCRRYGGLEQGRARAGLFGKIWQGWQEMEMVVKNGGDGKIWKFRGWRSPTTGQIGNIYQYPQAQTKKGEFSLPQCDGICFLDGNIYHFWTFSATETVISHKFPNSQFLPNTPIFVFISYSIISAKHMNIIIYKFGIFWHLVFFGFLVVSCMLALSVSQPVSSSNFQNVVAVYIYIMPDIQELFAEFFGFFFKFFQIFYHFSLYLGENRWIFP